MITMVNRVPRVRRTIIANNYRPGKGPDGRFQIREKADSRQGFLRGIPAREAFDKTHPAIG